jgi:multiple sugar transport system substrate-binding protein
MTRKIVCLIVAVLLISLSPALIFAKGGKEKAGGTVLPSPKKDEAMDKAAERIAKDLGKGKDVTLHVILTWDAPGQALEKVIPLWEKATGVKVKVERLSTLEMSQKVNLELASGNPEYDMIQYDKYIYKPVLENKAVLNLDPFMKAFPFHFEGMMTGQDKWGVADDGTNRMVPFYWCTYNGVYRKDLLDDPKEHAAFKAKYGYDYDVNALTLDKSYKDVAAFFTRDTNKDGKIDMWGAAEMFAAYAAGDTFMGRYINYWTADKAYLFDPKTGKATFNDDAARACLKDLMDVVKAKHMVPEILQTDWSSILGVFGSGKAAMALCYDPTWVAVQSPSGEFKISGPDKVGFIHMPGVTGHARSTISSGWMSFIPEKAKNPALAYLFLAWASSPAIDKEMALTTLHNPVRQSTYQDADVLKVNPTFATEYEHKEGQVAVPAVLIYDETQLILSNHIAAMASGKETIEQCITKSAAEMEAKWVEVTGKK